MIFAVVLGGIIEAVPPPLIFRCRIFVTARLCCAAVSDH